MWRNTVQVSPVNVQQICPSITSADYTNTVQVLPVIIPQTLFKYYKWMFGKKLSTSVTSRDSTNTVQLSPVNIQLKLSRYQQCKVHCTQTLFRYMYYKWMCGAHKHCPVITIECAGITSEYSTKPVKLLTVNSTKAVHWEKGICPVLWEKSMCWILKKTLMKLTLERGLIEGDSDFNMKKKKFDK